MRLKYEIAGTAALLVSMVSLAQNSPSTYAANKKCAEQRLSFQTGHPWTPRTNLNAGVVMVYGIGPRMAENMESWRQHGYITEVMTGVAWGGYQDYLSGRFDGKNHMDQAQMDANGDPVLHGGNASIPYISPSESYGRYLSQGILHALDAGATAIDLEEPEFWAKSGWEESFKREWKAFYDEEWQAPNSSPDAQYRASKLKYFLYRRALGQVFEYVKEYGTSHGRNIPCYVATHSLLNYANWKIVSPESSLLAVGVDGYIAQVWTGTARTPNYYDGVRKERTFETAFLEYGSMQNLARASGRRIWYLNDPIEDDPNHDWSDYRSNWESTLTASLLQPEVWRYEIMPWPDRVFNSKHPVGAVITQKKSIKELDQTPVGTGLGGFGPESNVEKVGIPKAYETEIQSVIGALGNMKQSEVSWQMSGTQNVGVLVSDTMMFERAAPTPSDAALGSFYGLALPLVKRGIPVEPVQIESALSQGFLDNFKLLFLTYEGQKPPVPEFHDVLARWIRNGGAVVVVDNDDDPYNAVREWWNAAPNAFKTPRQHLFAKLGIPENSTGLHRVGRGVVLSERVSPASLTYKSDGGARVLGYAMRAAAAVNLSWKETNAMVLRRGPYVIASGLDESIPGHKSYVLHGKFVNLFDANLPVITQVVLRPNSREFLLDLDRIGESDVPKVVAASCRITHNRADQNNLAFDADGIADTNAVVRIATKEKLSSVTVDGTTLQAQEFEVDDGTVLIHFQNSASPRHIEIRLSKGR